MANIQPRSQRLLAFLSSAASNSPGFTCPTDHVTLVKSAVFHNGGVSTATATWLIGTPSPGPSLAVFNSEITSGQALNWEGLLTLNPGDGFYVYVSDANMGVWISGAVLSGAPVVPPAEEADPVFIPPFPPPPYVA